MATLAALAAAVIAWLLPFAASAPILARTTFEPPPPPRATIIFGGDMMFDRSVREAMAREGDDHVFSCIADTLRGADLVVANLEGPITTHASVSVGSVIESPENFTFTFPTTSASLLKRHNISLVALGNNHALNFGREGLAQTRQWLEAAGVAYFGDPDAGEAERVARIEIGGIPFSFVNWSDWTSDTTDHAIAQVRAEAASGRIVVVYAHWGDEYVPPPPRVRQLAHSFLDAGAQIVIGSHPHIVQEHEIVGGKYIFYSLGNFVFDQYFSEEVRSGLLLRVAFDAEGVAAIEPIPIYLERDRRTCLKNAQ